MHRDYTFKWTMDTTNPELSIQERFFYPLLIYSDIEPNRTIKL